MARILIVDDDAGIRQFIQAVLENAGHDLGFANDGEQAVKFCRRGGFDLVILDLILPKKNGIRVIEEILERDAGAKIIAISGDVPKQLEMALDAGALHALPKPVTAEQLLSTIASVLRRSTGWQGVLE